MAKQFIKEIEPYKKLYRDNKNGITWIEDGSTGLGISVHPNIDKSGSITGMKKVGSCGKIFLSTGKCMDKKPEHARKAERRILPVLGFERKFHESCPSRYAARHEIL